MALFDWLTSFIRKEDTKETVPSNFAGLKINVVIAEFSDNIESNGGEILSKLMREKEGLGVLYFDEPFSKTFLNLESRTLFDMVDRGQDIIDKTESDVLVWGYQEGDKIRLNFQSNKQYETEEYAFISLIDSLYIPSKLLHSSEPFPEAISNLIYGAIISAVKPESKEIKIYKKYLIRKIIDKLSKDNSAKFLSIDYMPYIMNFLGIIYLNYAFEGNDEKDFKLVKSLFDTALKHQNLINNPIHLGCIYNHMGQLYDSAGEYMEKKTLFYLKHSINYYRYAQKYLGKYNYPYDYGYISFRLAKLFFSYWRKKEDIQALRDAVFQLREAEKIYTYALFPEFWAYLQGQLGYMLSLLGNLTKSEDISDLAIASFKNQQKVITERREPLDWAKIQEKIGDIYYRIGRGNRDRALLEEALEYFHDALYIFENMQLDEDVKTITVNISKTSQYLNGL